MLWVLLYLRWITNNELLCSTGNSTQLYDSLDGRGIFGTRIHGYIWLSPFTVHLKLRIFLIIYTPIQKKIFLIKYVLWGCRRRTSILCRENKEQESEERNRERGELWTLFFFYKIFIEVWQIFSIALSSAAQQCDSVIHIQKYIFFFLFFFMWFMT